MKGGDPNNANAELLGRFGTMHCFAYLQTDNIVQEISKSLQHRLP